MSQEELLQFREYAHRYNKSYKNSIPAENVLGATPAVNQKFHNYLESVRRVNLCNSDPSCIVKKSINNLSDMSPKEFSNLLGTIPIPSSNASTILKPRACSYEKHNAKKANFNATGDTLIDWRGTGVLTPVKHQGNCGTWLGICLCSTGRISLGYFRTAHC